MSTLETESSPEVLRALIKVIAAHNDKLQRENDLPNGSAESNSLFQEFERQLKLAKTDTHLSLFDETGARIPTNHIHFSDFSSDPEIGEIEIEIQTAEGFIFPSQV